MRSVFKLTTLAVAGIALVGVTGTAPSYAQDKLIATSWGGAYSMSQREAYYKPFAKETGITVLEDEWDGSMAKVRAMVETNNYTTHVIDAETSDVLQGCDDGTLAEIDYDMLGGRDLFIDGAALDCGVGTITWSTIYAYDGDVFPEGGARPTTMADLFDVEKFPGPRALYRNPNPTVVAKQFHQFEPWGLSGVMLVKESHISVHTWPEHQCACVDVFSCSEDMDPTPAFDYLREAFGAQAVDVQEIQRGRRAVAATYTEPVE